MTRHSKIPLKQTGFTLLELLVVITLISIIASVGLYSYEGADDDTRLTTTRFEMYEIRKALLQFRKDTGEFPCRVYRDGDYVAERTAMTPQLDFSGWLPATPTVADYQKWCSNGYEDAVNPNQADNALSMLRVFAYDVTVPANRDLLYNPDLHLGWHGPYIDKNQGLQDGWGNSYRLLQPELDYGLTHRCKINSNGYETTGGFYLCLPLDQIDELEVEEEPTDYILPANTVRLVSLGPNGRFESGFSVSANPCVAGGDDIVVCLLQ
jgi:prepilin-type N-terminal cleavage/methylation domain-containing protein